MRIAVVDSGSGNLASVERALARAAADHAIEAQIEITADPATVDRADRIVLPGQGAFAACARGLAASPGLTASLGAAEARGAAFLGICVGMQLMAQRGLEHAVTPGFGWIAGDIALLPAPGLRLPQMGWNALDFASGVHPLLDGISPGAHVYFVHSYGLQGYDANDVVATTSYGGSVPALVARGARAGTQFHVEKSQEVGLRILANFLRWSPATPAGAAA
jgi:glutamine amidotransferase